MSKRNKKVTKTAAIAVRKPKIKKKKTNSNVGSLVFLLLTFGFVAAAVVINVANVEIALLYRVLIALVLIVLAAACFSQTKVGKSLIILAKGTQLELRKVTWITRNETLQTAGMVFVFVLLVGLFLWLIDSIFIALINSILG